MCSSLTVLAPPPPPRDARRRSKGPHHAGEESERLQVLQDVAVLGGDEDHVEFLQRLVHVANAVRFHKGVLLARVHQLREGGQEALDARPGHFHKLPRYDGLAGLGAHRRCQQHLQGETSLDRSKCLQASMRRRIAGSEDANASNTAEGTKSRTVSPFYSTVSTQNLPHRFKHPHI